MSGQTGAVMTLGRATVGDWSVVMSLSRPWTVTRGREAAVTISLTFRVCVSSLTVRRLVFFEAEVVNTVFIFWFWLGLVIY